MESRNPVFARSEEFRRGGYATFSTPSAGQLEDMYAAPSATSLQTGRMTLDDVVVRSAMVFVVLLLAAAATFEVLPLRLYGLVLVAAVVGLVLGLVNSFKRNPSPALILAYAAFEGVFVGGISRIYELRSDGIVAQAVLGTLTAFGTMLALYKFRVIRATPKFTRVLIIAGVSYFVFSLVHLIGVWTHLWNSVYAGGGLLPIGLSALGVVLASLYLVLDFDYIEQGIRNGLPQRFAWQAAFGLVVTLVWLYLEILRLIAILNRR
ncbi:MAG TPA: Bax inhibitor-1/YccA family protein [Kineosporiaceae bacterium]|nr:Bax inhibitor-1/YccA family protein [Kineosporiaceae bacterium]